MKDSRHYPRRGTTLIETLVAFSLLVTVLGVVAPLTVRHTRLLSEGRAYRYAVDELSNQLASLTTMSVSDLTQAIADLPSQELAGPLAGAELTGQLDAIDVGQRITLSLEWPRTDRKRPTVTLVGWAIPPTPVEEATP